MKLNLGQIAWLLWAMLVLLSSARSTPIRMEPDGIKTYQICNACMDKDFPKFAALYQNTDIGRQLGIPNMKGLDCSKGKFLRVKCDDACIIVKILTKNGKGEIISYEVMTDCSTSLMEDHPSLQNTRDIAHIKENITFTDNFDQIKTDVVYSFIMGDTSPESENLIIQQELQLEKREILENSDQINPIQILILFFSICLIFLLAYQFYPIFRKMARSVEEGYRHRNARHREIHVNAVRIGRGGPPGAPARQNI
ncbi:unnamed protein product [Caenorhabditis angaria]|uniref:Uncharacterized protein n=1 Tax=Caenorhabditis angaria TaxID=860376 RepID=A0A9P1MYI9_9PELO|nr:unnamed protein product [Caenorhabditis angaria]